MTKIIATLSAEDFKMPEPTHLARCLILGCPMRLDPREARDEQDARAWAKAHIGNQPTHRVQIEEIEG